MMIFCYLPLPRRPTFATAAALVFTAVVGMSPCSTAAVAADDASGWIRDLHSAVRLIAGPREGGTLSAGVAFQIQPGWKTYWRTPGDSGVPPRFDFSASDNVEMVTVLWPAPMRFPDGAGGTSFGYKTKVVLPLRIVAKEPDRPVTLRAEINYAVCEKLCVPVEARSEVVLPSAAGDPDPSLVDAFQAVPKPATVGEANALTVVRIARNANTVAVDVKAPDTGEVELFVEGPTPDWALPPPTFIERTPDGLLRYTFELDGLPSGARPDGAALKLTLTNGSLAHEYAVTLP